MKTTFYKRKYTHCVFGCLGMAVGIYFLNQNGWPIHDYNGWFYILYGLAGIGLVIDFMLNYRIYILSEQEMIIKGLGGFVIREIPYTDIEAVLSSQTLLEDEETKEKSLGRELKIRLKNGDVYSFVKDDIKDLHLLTSLLRKEVETHRVT